MDDYSSLYDCFYEAIFREIRKSELQNLLSEKKTDRERVELLLTLPSAKNLTIPDSFEGKSTLKSDRLLGEAVENGTLSDLYNMAILTAPEFSTAMASGFVARAEALLREGDPASARLDAERALHLEDLLEPEELFSAYQTIGCALCMSGEWELAAKHLEEAVQKLRLNKMDNASKATIVGRLVPLLKKARKSAEEMKGVKELNLKSGVKVNDRTHKLPQVSYGVNPAIPAASVSVKYSHTEEKGRYLIAATNIKAGDIVIVEDAFSWSTQKETALKSHCLHCLRRARAPIPCKKCSTVAFCDTACRDESWEQYHKYECSILNHFYGSKEMSGMALLVFRIVAKAGIDTLISVPKSPTVPSSRTPFRTMDYSSVFWQETHSQERSNEDLLKRTVNSIFLLRCLQKGGFVPPSLDDEPSLEELLVGSILLRHLQSCSCNAYEVTETLVGGGRGVRHSEPFEIGGAVYPTISLLNHSCYPNLARHSVNGKFCVVRASRNIRAGEELLDNYGMHFVKAPLEERLRTLERQYFFHCCCVACSEEWEVFDKLKATRYKCVVCGHDLGVSLGTIKSCPQCQKGDNQKVKRRFQYLSKEYSGALQKLLEGRVDECLITLMEYLGELEKHVFEPCKEVIICQQAMNQCWSLMGNKDEG